MKLLGVPASHPALAAELMLRRKGLAYRRRDLPSMSQRLVLPLLRLPGKTVPVLYADGSRVQGTMKIARFLDELQPEPRLVPDDERVLALEAWADETLQDTARWLAVWAAKHDPGSLVPIALGARLGLPRPVIRATIPVLAPLLLSVARVTDEAARGRLARLPAELDRVDAALAEGLIGGAEPNAADYQVATSVRLLLNAEQLAPPIDARPAGEHARRLAPDYPGSFAAVFPDEWLEPLLGL